MGQAWLLGLPGTWWPGPTHSSAETAVGETDGCGVGLVEGNPLILQGTAEQLPLAAHWQSSPFWLQCPLPQHVPTLFTLHESHWGGAVWRLLCACGCDDDGLNVVGLAVAFIPNGQLQPTRSRLAARDVANLISCIALTLSSSDLPGGK